MAEGVVCSNGVMNLDEYKLVLKSPQKEAINLLEV